MLQSRMNLHASVNKSAQIKQTGAIFNADLAGDFKKEEVLILFRKLVTIYKNDINIHVKNEIFTLLKTANELFP